jgi:hypothetical protein
VDVHVLTRLEAIGRVWGPTRGALEIRWERTTRNRSGGSSDSQWQRSECGWEEAKEREGAKMKVRERTTEKKRWTVRREEVGREKEGEGDREADRAAVVLGKEPNPGRGVVEERGGRFRFPGVRGARLVRG